MELCITNVFNTSNVLKNLWALLYWRTAIGIRSKKCKEAGSWMKISVTHPKWWSSLLQPFLKVEFTLIHYFQKLIEVSSVKKYKVRKLSTILPVSKFSIIAYFDIKKLQNSLNSLSPKHIIRCLLRCYPTRARLAALLLSGVSLERKTDIISSIRYMLKIS